MFVALISVPYVDYVRSEFWGIPWTGLEGYTAEHWTIRTGMYAFEGDDMDSHEITARTYWGRQET